MEVLLSRIETTYYCFFVADYMHLLVFYSSSAASCSELWYKTQECVDCICKLQKDPIIKHFKKKTKNWELLIYKGRRKFEVLRLDLLTILGFRTWNDLGLNYCWLVGGQYEKLFPMNIHVTESQSNLPKISVHQSQLPN